MTQNTTEFGAIEAQTADEPTETTFSDFGSPERSNRSEPETRLETETATEFGIDDRQTKASADSGSQAEITADTDGQLDLSGEPAAAGPAWSDDRDASDETRYLGDVYGPTMKQPIPDVERSEYVLLSEPVDDRELVGTPVGSLDMNVWTVEAETGIHRDDIRGSGARVDDQEHFIETGESRISPNVEDPADYVDELAENTSTPTNAVERAENCDHPSTSQRTCTDEYGNEHTKHVCDRCNFTVGKHSGTHADHCDHCGIDRGEGIETDGGQVTRIPPKCPVCGGRNVVKAGKTEENCEDCAIFFVPSETDIDRGFGIQTDGGRPPQANFSDFHGTDSEQTDESNETMTDNTDADEATSNDLQVSETREQEAADSRNDGSDRMDSSTRAVADGGEIEAEPVAIDADDWDVSEHAGEEVLIITGITRVMSAPSTVNGEISSSGKTISVPKPHREESTVRLDTEKILSGESEYRDSRYYELYTPARLAKNQRSNHAPGPQAGANSVTDPEDAPAPTHWPAIEQPDDVPNVCPNCEEAAAPFQVEHVKSPRCENCGELLEEMQKDDEEEENEEPEPSAVNMQTWERGGVIETPDASLMITRLSRSVGYDTVLRAQAVDEENRRFMLGAPSTGETLYVERDSGPSPVVYTDEIPDYSDDEATYVGVDEDRFRTWIREEYYSDYTDDDDDRDGGIDHGGDGPDDFGTGSSDGQESNEQETEEEPPKILADGGFTPDSSRTCARCDNDAQAGSRFCAEHDSVDRGDGPRTDGGQWDVTGPVDLDDYLPLDMANNIVDDRVKERIAWVDGLGRAYADALEGETTQNEQIDRGTAVKADGGRADLLTWMHPDDAPDDALDGRQLVELKEGVRAAIEAGERALLSAPGNLSGDRWSNAGVGINVYMHRSGVVVLESGEDHIVTDADTLDHMSTARAVFFANPGPAVVASDDVEQAAEAER